MSNFQGAVVEDLQLGTALVLPSSTLVSVALRMAFEREFSYLPLIDPVTRKLSGYVDIAKLKLDASHETNEETTLAELSKESVKSFETRDAYTVITPSTSLEELESFFHTKRTSFALVTDQDRKFVLAVVTEDDLKKFTSRRYPNGNQ